MAYVLSWSNIRIHKCFLSILAKSLKNMLEYIYQLVTINPNKQDDGENFNKLILCILASRLCSNTDLLVLTILMSLYCKMK